MNWRGGRVKKGEREGEGWEKRKEGEELCVSGKKKKGEVQVDIFNAKDWSRVAWTWFVCVFEATKPGHAYKVRKGG